MRTCLLLLLLVVSVHAEENKPTHDELRALRDRLLIAVNKSDIEAMTACLTTNAIVTWQNGDVSHGRDGFHAYYDRMMTAPGHIVEGFTTAVDVDELTTLYGDSTGVALGSAEDHFKLEGGLDIQLHDRWTATVVKQEGHWLIASVHVSANVFDNPLLTAAKRTLLWAIPVTGIIGLLIGFFIGKRCRT